MLTLRLRFSFAFALGLASLAGCEDAETPISPASSLPDASSTDGSVDATPDAADTSTGDAARPFAVDDGVEKVSLAHVSLGGVPGCYLQERTVEYVRATRTMTWAACTAPDAGPTGFPASTRDLTTSEGAEVEAALRAIDYEVSPPCESYDGPEYYMFTTGSDGGSKRYSAGNVNCYGDPRAPKIADAYRILDALPK